MKKQLFCLALIALVGNAYACDDNEAGVTTSSTVTTADRFDRLKKHEKDVDTRNAMLLLFCAYTFCSKNEEQVWRAKTEQELEKEYARKTVEEVMRERGIDPVSIFQAGVSAHEGALEREVRKTGDHQSSTFKNDQCAKLGKYMDAVLFALSENLG